MTLNRQTLGPQNDIPPTSTPAEGRKLKVDRLGKSSKRTLHFTRKLVQLEVVQVLALLESNKRTRSMFYFLRGEEGPSVMSSFCLLGFFGGLEFGRAV
jgi:hypothetical protein